MRLAALLFPAIATFRLPTLATKGAQLKANPANRYQRQDRQIPHDSLIEPVRAVPHRYNRHNQQRFSSLTSWDLGLSVCAVSKPIAQNESLRAKIQDLYSNIPVQTK
jgi:hypothetical protein